ncbi:TLC domain-containing protein 2 [Hydra vulgaris]|uniref:TLC domain-containing protein 2 n=1 Tax=Hydra vulgaris TaxID=6087 RepID=A0ABM4BCT9_HYDVU
MAFYFIGSCAFFCSINKSIGVILKHKNLTTVKNDRLVRNTICSLIHSTISSIGTVLCYVETPTLSQNFINTSSKLAHLLLLFSSGYFLYDIGDMIMYDGGNQLVVIAHHALAIMFYATCMKNNHCIGFAVFSLVAEYSSVFLHIRRLLIIANMRNSCIYTTIKYCLIASVLVCRVGGCLWMWKHLIYNSTNSISKQNLLIGVLALLYITPMNIGMMRRLWIVDFQSQRKKTLNKKF